MISGLPQNTINVTLDGVNVEQQHAVGRRLLFDGPSAARRGRRGDGDRRDAGRRRRRQGSVQVAFVTRSGTNQYAGTVYHYFRHPSLNTNYFFNERQRPRPKNQRHPAPVRRPRGRTDRHPGPDRRPRQGVLLLQLRGVPPADRATRTREILNPTAQQGMFRYNDGQRRRATQVNLLALAAANGQSRPRSIRRSSALLNEIRAAHARPAPSCRRSTRTRAVRLPGSGSASSTCRRRASTST